MRRSLLLGLFVLGCGGAPAQLRGAADLDGALHGWLPAEATGARSVGLRRDGPIRQPVRIARARAAPVPRGRVIDVRFEQAPLASALSLLADAANLGLVVGEGVDGSVSADLRRVRPWIAMQALAEAHEVELSRVGRTVIARGR